MREGVGDHTVELERGFLKTKTSKTLVQLIGHIQLWRTVSSLGVE